jgi:hypothetical protein
MNDLPVVTCWGYKTLTAINRFSPDGWKGTIVSFPQVVLDTPGDLELRFAGLDVRLDLPQLNY